MDVGPVVKTVKPTVVFIVTVWLADLGPLQPAAVAVITDVPVQVAV